MDIFQVILSETANRIFLAESGRKILSALIVKARKVNLLASLFYCYYFKIKIIKLLIEENVFVDICKNSHNKNK